MMETDDWRFRHVGVIVRDTAATYDFYRTLGFRSVDPPFQTPVRTADNPRTSRIARVERAGVTMEFIQPLAGTFVNKEFLDTVGEGVNHIAFTVSDLEGEVERLGRMGFPALYGNERCAYCDTRRAGNVIIELIRR
jgi:methylmalonyl-CoA/ethylmalonyl-CoA epimerase